jgi:hypothetical protein
MRQMSNYNYTIQEGKIGLHGWLFRQILRSHKWLDCNSLQSRVLTSPPAVRGDRYVAEISNRAFRNCL